ncbi:Endo/exonuclease/phosphatase domain-containing protein [Aphis craccivora]|uniref:Endo/exonuclease/phosphatase domain-containing protein n=1 Tax=Aphis craccivora TaxID=307492 RepID=A0A6G0ZLV9_APHCR|nr:Endo/exonuclease/phosphatase domain-containing protein [Aphis craccivora]
MWSINELLSNNIVNLVANSFINYIDLKQCNNVINHRQDILDLIFSDSQINNIRMSSSLTPIFDAYHPPLELIYPLTSSPVTLVESLTHIMYNFNSCKFDEVRIFLSEFDFILDAATSKFYEIIRHTFDNITWKDPVLLILNVIISIFLNFSMQTLKIENNINSDSKYFWKYIQSLRSNKTNIPTTVYLDNIVSDNINYTTKFTGVFPDIWKQSFVTPIYKSGDKSNVRNYRPITKLSGIPKLFEAIITKKLISLLKLSNFKQPLSLKTLYCSLVRSTLEFGSMFFISPSDLFTLRKPITRSGH